MGITSLLLTHQPVHFPSRLGDDPAFLMRRRRWELLPNSPSAADRYREACQCRL